MTTTLEELDRRVAALERTQNDTTETLRWVVTKLARMQAVQDEHTLRLERIEFKIDGVDKRLDGVDKRLDGLDKRLERVETDLKGLRTDLPGIVGAAVREALNERG